MDYDIHQVTTATTLDPAPSWSAADTPTLCCPLCEYNLRGLDQPRCPECGFAFTWAELLRGQREKHPYLFEHHPERNVWSFFKTYWSDSFPQSFWSKISPAQAVRLWRLLFFCVVSNLPMVIAISLPFDLNLWEECHVSPPPPVTWSPSGPLGLRGYVPPTFVQCVQTAWDVTADDFRDSPLMTGSLTVLLWPWLTFACLLVFAQSMRKARIKRSHVFRMTVYGSDFGFLMLVILLLGHSGPSPAGWRLFIATVCAGITLHRLYYAYSRYLRFHMPFLTVLTSQIMVFLVALIVYLQTWMPW